jgi:hypothetical protein
LGVRFGEVIVLDPRQTLLESTLQRLYEVISFPEGGGPDFDGMKQLFVPCARVTRITPEGTDELDLPGFQSMVDEMLDVGVFTSFYEVEVARRVERFGCVAHVLSLYETKRSEKAASVLGRGINSIQLMWNGEAWRIVSLLWDEGLPVEQRAFDAFEGMERVYGRS